RLTRGFLAPVFATRYCGQGLINHFLLAAATNPSPYFAPVADRDTKSGRTEKHLTAGDTADQAPSRREGNCPQNGVRTVRRRDQQSKGFGGITMRIRRQFTVEGNDAYDGIAFVRASSEIRNPDGSVVFRQTDIEVPEEWSQVACDVLAQKYFRKA